jgi:hypothetical protein
MHHSYCRCARVTEIDTDAYGSESINLDKPDRVYFELFDDHVVNRLKGKVDLSAKDLVAKSETDQSLSPCLVPALTI